MFNDTVGLSSIILDSLSDGIFVCDRQARVVYWNKAAERITGWTSKEIVGRECLEDILCPIDKEGRHLRGEEFCPLYRAMVTGQANTYPVVVFGQAKDGGRVPLIVSVAPILDASGDVIGGVETFRDFSRSYASLESAKRIQTLSQEHDLPADPRLSVSTFYWPHDVVGGDYFSIRSLGNSRYGFFLADVMGHGIAAALHTMHLSSLWSRYSDLLATPAQFARRLNDKLVKIVKDESFATAVCGVLDAETRSFRYTAAGGPPVVLFGENGEARELDGRGIPFGVVGHPGYEEEEVSCAAGDVLLMFSDGAVEIEDAEGHMLGTEGLIRILKSLGYPKTGFQNQGLQEALLRFSSGIRLEDDITFIEIRLARNAPPD